MKNLLIALALTSSFSAQALPVINPDQCGSMALPGVNAVDPRIECIGYTPFDPTNPTHSGAVSVLRVNSPVAAQTQNGVAGVSWGQSNQYNGYIIGQNGIAESSGSLNGVRGVKGEAYSTGTGDDVAAGQLLVAASKSPDSSLPNIIRGLWIRARAHLLNLQPVDAAIEISAEQGASYKSGIKMNGNSIEWDPLHRRVAVPGFGVCDQYRPNENAAWR